MAATKYPALGFKMTIEGSPFKRDLDRLDNRTQQKVLKRVLRDVQRTVFLPVLKANTPRRPGGGNLFRSMGIVAGRRNYIAAMFAGPRIQEGSKTGMGWVANILENWKDPRKKRTHYRSIIKKNMNTPSSRPSANGPPAPVTAAWTSSRITASSSASAKVNLRIWTCTTAPPSAPWSP